MVVFTSNQGNPVGCTDKDTYVVVVTSFGNGDLFTYQVNFDGTMPVELMSISAE